MSVRYLSVCSGIEAATVAWRPLGWMPVAFAEIEPFPSAVLAHHYPEVPNLGDITRFAAWPDLAIDLLVGGTPCQSFSVAGLRKGLADPRGNLALTYLAIADRYRPRWLLWENVPGVLSSGGGRDFGAFLGGLGELGYGFAYRVLDAQFVRVDGFERAVPQRRRRVFVVGHLGDWRRAAAVLFDAASLHGDPAPRREAGKGTAESPAYGISPDCFDRSGEGAGGSASERSGLGVEEEIAYSLRAKRPGGVAFGGNRTSGPLDVATAVNAHGGPHGWLDFESETFVCAPPLTGNPYGDHESREGLLVAHSLRGEGFDASEDGTGRGTPPVPVAFDTTQITSAANRSQPKAGDPCHPLAAGVHPPAIAFQSSQSGVREGETHATLDANMGSRRHNGVVTPSGVRRLLPVECERLQGFPDRYTDAPFRGKPASDGPRYKALGNSMSVNVIRWLGTRIQGVEDLTGVPHHDH